MTCFFCFPEFVQPHRTIKVNHKSKKDCLIYKSRSRYRVPVAVLLQQPCSIAAIGLQYHCNRDAVRPG